MKKIIPAITSTLIFATSFIVVTAQKSIDKTVPDGFKNEIASVPVNNARAENKDHSILYKINFNAVQHFKTTYPEINNERWAKLRDGGYLASFVLNSVYTRSYYDKKGNWLHSLQRYDETKLPDDVRLLMQETFADYSITAVEQVSTNRNNRKPIYLIYIQQDKKHKIIRVCDGEMEEIEI